MGKLLKTFGTIVIIIGVIVMLMCSVGDGVETFVIFLSGILIAIGGVFITGFADIVINVRLIREELCKKSINYDEVIS